METYTYEETIKTPEPKKRRGKTFVKVAALALGCSLLACGLFFSFLPSRQIPENDDSK